MSDKSNSGEISKEEVLRRIRDNPEEAASRIYVSASDASEGFRQETLDLVSEVDLERAFSMAYPDMNARELTVSLLEVIRRRGGDIPWDTLAWVAQLSPEHEKKVRTYLGWTAEQMAQAIAEVRNERDQ